MRGMQEGERAGGQADACPRLTNDDCAGWLMNKRAALHTSRAAKCGC